MKNNHLKRNTEREGRGANLLIPPTKTLTVLQLLFSVVDKSRTIRLWSSVLAFVLLIGIRTIGWAAEDDIKVKAEVDRAFLTIGDPVTYTVTIESAPSIQVLSHIPAPDSEFLEIKKVADIHEKRKNKVITGRKFTLTTYRLGEFVLDPIIIQYRREGQPEKTIQTNKLYLTVKSVAEGDPKEDIRDVKSVVPMTFRFGKFLMFLLILVLLGTGYWIYWKFRSKKGLLQPEAVLLTPAEEALQRLAELFESDLLKRGFVKIYYLRLSEILRIYFEKLYKILAVESTTIETLRALREQHLSAPLYQKIQYVLEMSDLAKFAKWIPSASEVLSINRSSEEIVRESSPPPPSVETPKDDSSHAV